MEKQTFDKALGKFIRKKREDNGWTQADLASKIGHNYQNVSRIERGEHSPTLYWCMEFLAPAFEMGASEFVDDFEKFKLKKSL